MATIQTTGKTAVAGNLAKIVMSDGSGTSHLLARATQWSANPTQSETAWGDSDGGVFTLRKGARRDCTGTCEGKLDSGAYVTELDPWESGTALPLICWEDASRYWDFPSVVVSSLQLAFNIDTKEVVSWSFNWGADGVFYRPGESGAANRTLPTTTGP